MSANPSAWVEGYDAESERDGAPGAPSPPLDAYDDSAMAEREAIQSEPALAAPSRVNGTDPLGWMEDCELTARRSRADRRPAWVHPGLFAEGHVIAVVAKPNGGKTTICFHIACELASRYTVIYIDSDTNPADAKRKLVYAKQHGIRYLTPDLKVGKSMRDVVAELELLAQSDADLTGHVWFFDTLKKMANVIHKDSLKHVLGLMRKLSGRGMTCVLLASHEQVQERRRRLSVRGHGRSRVRRGRVDLL